jgi:hypothetical protein
MDDLFLAAFAHVPVPPDINEREAINADHVRFLDELEAERRRNLDDASNNTESLHGDHRRPDDQLQERRHDERILHINNHQARDRGTQQGRRQRPRNMQPPRHAVRPVNQNPITYQQMVEGVVDQSVGSKYVNKILLLMDWAFLNQQDWLCADVITEYPTINRQMIDVNYTQSRK